MADENNQTFDIDAARKAGVSDERIKQYLIKQSGGQFDVESALKDGVPLDRIASHISHRSNLFQQTFGDINTRGLSPQVEHLRQTNMQNALQGAQTQQNPNSLGQVIQHPFGSLVNSLGGSPRGQIGANVLDYPFHAAAGIGSGISEFAQATQAPDKITAAAQAAQGIGKMAMGGFMALNPLTGIPVSVAQEAISAASPKAAALMNEPATTIFNPQTPAGKAIAGVADMAVPALAMGALGKVFEGADTRNFEPNTLKTIKPEEQFMKALPRPVNEGAVQGQFDDVRRAQPYLSNAFKEGLEDNPNKTLSTRVVDKIEPEQDRIWQNEVAIAKQHPNEKVNLGGSAIKKLKTQEMYRDDPRAHAIIDDLSSRYDVDVSPEQSLKDMSTLNNSITKYYKAINTPNAIPEFSPTELNFREMIAREARHNYADVMENKVGVKGVRDNHLAFGALEGVKNDVIRGQKTIDALPRGFFEKATLSGYASPAGVRGRIGESLMNFLGRDPASYVAKATKGWADLKQTPPALSNMGGLLPSQGTSSAGTSPSQPGSIVNIKPPRPTPSGAVQQTAPESFVRGTGLGGLDVNAWQRQTSANPEQTQYVTHEATQDLSPEERLSNKVTAFRANSDLRPNSTEEGWAIGKTLTADEAHASYSKYKSNQGVKPPENLTPFEKSQWYYENSQVPRERAEGFVTDKFKNVDTGLGSLNAYSAEQLQQRLDWLHQGNDAKDFPTPMRSNEAPPAAQKAKKKAQGGDKLSLRERNLIRQHYPNEIQSLLT